MEYKNAVFCYGSNSIEQLKGRLSNNDLVSYSAYLDRYKRIFCGYSKNWNGGVASLIHKKFNKTYGIIVFLTQDELLKLDSYEINYTRKEINCYVMINNIYILHKCFTYFANNNNWIEYPSQQYLISIKIMLNEYFSFNYIIISKINDSNKIENLHKWNFPKDINSLSLESLFIIVNSFKNNKWNVPTDINKIVNKLKLINITNIDILKTFLINKEKFNELNNLLAINNHSKLSMKIFFIFKSLLK